MGGASLAGLARALHNTGVKIYGWEFKINERRSRDLIQLGIKIFSNQIPIYVLRSVECVIHSSIKTSDEIRKSFNICSLTPIFSQFEFLNLLISNNIRIAVTGSYGKTITTSMICSILDYDGYNVCFSCGGIQKNFNMSTRISTSNVWVVEAVETHNNFLNLESDYGIILNIENLNQIEKFKAFLKNNERSIFINIDDSNCEYLLLDGTKNFITFGYENATADYRAINIQNINNQYEFDIIQYNLFKGHITVTSLGSFSLTNVLAACTFSLFWGISIEKLSLSLSKFLGVVNRFDIVFRSETCIFISDIAHHPISIKESLLKAKQFGNENCIVLYRPHMFSELAVDCDDILEALKIADKIVLLDIESVKDSVDDGQTSLKFVSTNVLNCNKLHYFSTNMEIVEWLKSFFCNSLTIIQMGMYIDEHLTNDIISLLKSQIISFD